MNREQTLELIYSARTLEAVQAAEIARGLWLKQHPKDDEVLEIGAMLCRMRESIELHGVIEPEETELDRMWASLPEAERDDALEWLASTGADITPFQQKAKAA